MKLSLLSSFGLAALLFGGGCTDAPTAACSARTDCGECQMCFNGACVPESEPETNPTCTAIESRCGDGLDDDGDGRIDCADPNCAGAARCLPESNCGNALDDDGDGLTDCDDSDCADSPVCTPEASCGDGIDNDADGRVDCHDPDCTGSADCVETNCTNGLDDDADGRIDCEDLDCVGQPNCGETNCGDRADDDGDGDVDCADSDCAADPRCSPESNCQNGEDDDLDGLTDCADLDCEDDPWCAPETDCADLADNDHDGDMDCADSDCALSPDCREIACDDGIDNEDDGFIDCADSDCADNPICLPEANCADGIDDDDDGQIDCEEEGCGTHPHCTASMNEDCASAFVLPDNPNGYWGGSTVRLAADYTSNDCIAGGASRRDAAFRFTLSERLYVTIDGSRSAGHGRLFIYPADQCGALSTSACAPDWQSTSLVKTLDAGTYVAVVQPAEAEGDSYLLHFVTKPAEICTGGVDEDGDGRID